MNKKMTIKDQKYPEYFPENCPPESASTEKRILFRFCKGRYPDEEDFKSYYNLNPEKYRGNINAYGLSVLPSRDACNSAYRKYPYIRRYKTVAKGETDHDKGCWKNTPSNTIPDHITWWVCEGIKPVGFFMFDFVLGEENET